MAPMLERLCALLPWNDGLCELSFTSHAVRVGVVTEALSQLRVRVRHSAAFGDGAQSLHCAVRSVVA